MMKQYPMATAVMSIAVLLFACAGSRKNSAETSYNTELMTQQRLKKVSGVEWILTRMVKDGTTIALVENAKATFTCDEAGKVAGKATLNRYSGNLAIKESGEIVWNKAFIMTRMAGPPALMQQEADFTQVLMQTSRMFLKNEKLALMSEDGSYDLEFEPAR